MAVETPPDRIRPVALDRHAIRFSVFWRIGVALRAERCDLRSLSALEGVVQEAAFLDIRGDFDDLCGMRRDLDETAAGEHGLPLRLHLLFSGPVGLSDFLDACKMHGRVFHVRNRSWHEIAGRVAGRNVENASCERVVPAAFVIGILHPARVFLCRMDFLLCVDRGRLRFLIKDRDLSVHGCFPAGFSIEAGRPLKAFDIEVRDRAAEQTVVADRRAECEVRLRVAENLDGHRVLPRMQVICKVRFIHKPLLEVERLLRAVLHEGSVHIELVP